MGLINFECSNDYPARAALTVISWYYQLSSTDLVANRNNWAFGRWRSLFSGNFLSAEIFSLIKSRCRRKDSIGQRLEEQLINCLLIVVKKTVYKL